MKNERLGASDNRVWVHGGPSLEVIGPWQTPLIPDLLTCILRNVLCTSVLRSTPKYTNKLMHPSLLFSLFRVWGRAPKVWATLVITLVQLCIVHLY